VPDLLQISLGTTRGLRSSDAWFQWFVTQAGATIDTVGVLPARWLMATSTMAAAAAAVGRLVADVEGNAGRIGLHATADGVRLPAPKPALLAAVTSRNTVIIPIPSRVARIIWRIFML